MISALQLGVLASLFIAVAAGAFWGAQQLEGLVRVNRRLHDGAAIPAPGTPRVPVVKKQEVSSPLMAWVQSSTSLKDKGDRRKINDLLTRAGYEGPSAAVWFVIARFGLAIGLPLLFLVSQSLSDRPFGSTHLAILSLVLCGAGFIAPRAYVDRLAESRRKQLANEFPDALDLMVVCVEAGLGLESAFVRVGQEVVQSHPRIAEEFAALSHELRAGRTRAEALRNLADRTNVQSVRSFSALLIQTDALGTSIGQTLRTYSQEMREDRFFKAEEKAMRIPVLMTIPLVACILPVIVTALMLPGIIDVIRELIPAMKGVG